MVKELHIETEKEVVSKELDVETREIHVETKELHTETVKEGVSNRKVKENVPVASSTSVKSISLRGIKSLKSLSKIGSGYKTPSNNEFRPKFSVKATGQEARDYDFLGQRPIGIRTNMVESVAHLVKSCLGGGVVTIHEAYMQCGLWTAVSLNIILGFAVGYCMYILTKSAHRAYGRTQVPMMSYPDLAEAALEISHCKKIQRYGRTFRYLVDVTIMLDLFMSCCCYQCIMARALQQIIEGVDDKNSTDIRIYIAALLFPCILICMITSLKYLAPFSLVADFFIVIVAFTTVLFGVRRAPKPPTEYPAFKTVAGLFEFFGVCVFSMEGIGAILAIENSMEEPQKLPQMLTMGMSVVVVIVMTVGFFGYWGFGDEAKSPVTINFPFHTITTMLKVSMTFMVYVTYALNFWIPFNLLWFYLKKYHNPEHFWLFERIYRTLFVILVTLLAIAFPDVSKFMGLIGAFCLSNMGFIYPAFIELLLDWQDPGLGLLKWRLIKFISICVFGGILFFYGTYSNLRQLIEVVYYNK